VSIIFAPNVGIDVHGLHVKSDACSFSDQHSRFPVLATTNGEDCVLVADLKDANYMSMKADTCVISSERVNRDVVRNVLWLNM
jgi:hypothetical protein